MVEAQVICCEAVDIRDLNLNLKRGDEIWIDAPQAKASKDLLSAKQSGKVRVDYRERDRKQVRRHAPPNFSRMKAQTHSSQPDSAQEAPNPTTAAVMAEVKAEILGDLLGDLQKVIAEEIRKALSGVPAAPAAPAMTPEQMAAVMEGVLSRQAPRGAPVSPARSSESLGGDMPMYIPSGIVDKDSTSKIDIQEKNDSAGGLDDNAKLLREMRKNK